MTKNPNSENNLNKDSGSHRELPIYPSETTEQPTELDVNDTLGPFYNETGQRIRFDEWFHGGEPVRKRTILGPLISGLTVETFKPVALIASIMVFLTFTHQNYNLRLFISTTDLDINWTTFYRSLGSLFIHADLAHLGSNLLLFLPFGWLLGNYFGVKAFPLGALLMGVITNYLTVVIYAMQGRQSSLVGCSGMVYGMVAQWIALYLRWDYRLSLSERSLRAIGAAMMLLIPSQYSPKTSYLAHGIGFAVGLCFALPFMLKPKDTQFENN